MKFIIGKIAQFAISFIAALIIGAVAVLILLSLIGCQMSPTRDNYSTEECYCASDCIYRNKSNDDKSVCAMLIEACRDSMKEARIYQRLKYCAENKFGGMTESECRLFLNQK